MARNCIISGRVVDANGTLRAGSVISISNVMVNGVRNTSYEVESTSDASGVFSFTVPQGAKFHFRSNDVSSIDRLNYKAPNTIALDIGTYRDDPSFLPDQTDQSGKVLTTDGTNAAWTTPSAGSGDMEAATYDPQAIAGDAFDLSIHTGTNAAIAASILDAKTSMNVDSDNTLPATATKGEYRMLDNGRLYYAIATNTWLEVKTAGVEPFATATGTDTYAVDFTPNIPTLAAGQIVKVLFTNANTGAATLNPDGTGAVPITKNGSTALSVGDIPAGSIKYLVYDGTNLQIVGDGGGVTAPLTGNNATMMLPDGALFSVAATRTLTANTVYVYRYVFDSPRTISQMGFYVSTLHSGTFGSVGIYSADGNTKLFDTGPISMTTTGNKSAAAAGTLSAGVEYLVAVTGDSSTAAMYAAQRNSGAAFAFNAVRKSIGTAANASTAGQLPTTLGTITELSNLEIILVFLIG